MSFCNCYHVLISFMEGGLGFLSVAQWPDYWHSNLRYVLLMSKIDVCCCGFELFMVQFCRHWMVVVKSFTIKVAGKPRYHLDWVEVTIQQKNSWDSAISPFLPCPTSICVNLTIESRIPLKPGNIDIRTVHFWNSFRYKVQLSRYSVIWTVGMGTEVSG